MTRPRPVSPNMQNYRPQLTSVLSFAHRLSGIGLGLGAFGLAAWLAAGASGPGTFAAVQGLVLSGFGQMVLFGLTLALFYHLCNGVRHLIWDSVHAFGLRSIYRGGWIVLAASLVLTLLLWTWGLA